MLGPCYRARRIQHLEPSHGNYPVAEVPDSGELWQSSMPLHEHPWLMFEQVVKAGRRRYVLIVRHAAYHLVVKPLVYGQGCREREKKTDRNCPAFLWLLDNLIKDDKISSIIHERWSS